MTPVLTFGMLLAQFFRTKTLFLLSSSKTLFGVPMHLTMTGEYAIRTVLHLSSLSPGTLAQISDISKAWDIPETFLRKIVARLSHGGLVKSNRGVGGGVGLARPPEEITLLNVIEEVEGPLTLNRCLVEPGFCSRTKTCLVHDLWCDTQNILREALSSKTFAELARSRRNGPATD